jgi:hypothetical protein
VTQDVNLADALNALKPAWLAQAEGDLVTMSELMDAMASASGGIEEQSKRFYNISHNMKGQAGTFGFTLLSDIAARLCHYMRQQRSGVQPEHVPVLRAHHAALKFVFSKRIEGDGGAAGRTILAKVDALGGRSS